MRFRGSCIPEQDTSRLTKLVQGEFESLRSFVTRYHGEVTDLGAFDHPYAVEGLKKGLRFNRLWNNLYSKGVTTYAEAYDQEKLDMKTEDAEEEKRRMEEQREGPVKRGDPRKRKDNLGYSSRKNSDDRRHYGGELFNYKRQERSSRDWERNRERREISLIGRGRKGRNNYEMNQRENRARDYNRLPPPVDQRGSRSNHGVNLLEQSGRYTLLNTSRAEIYAAVTDNGLLTPPKPIVGSLGGSAYHKYCEFHRVSRNGTADCIDLKEHIEWLLQNQ